MIWNFIKKTVLGFSIFLAAIVSASANDSAAALVTGGLTLQKLENVEMVSEGLYISAQKIEINYVFENKSDKDITTIVAFPLPPVTTEFTGDEWQVKIEEKGPESQVSFIDFKTWVEGKQTTPKVIKKTFISPPDPNLPFFLQKDQTKGEYAYEYMQVTYYWQQTFPAGQPIHVKHIYKPVIGTYFFLVGIDDEEDVFRYNMSCIKDIYLPVKKRMEANPSMLMSYLDISLQTSTNWAGGIIGDFKLIVDKGKPEYLVSFCGENVKKISPTQFEMRAKNYKPKEDFIITIIYN